VRSIDVRGLLTVVALEMVACGPAEPRALPYCEGNVLHYEERGEVEWVRFRQPDGHDALLTT